MNHLTEQRECPNCGKLFWPNSGHQKYCSKQCSCESAKVRDKANRELYEQNKSMEKYIKEVKKSRKALANISEKAKDEGISYGQYVARHMNETNKKRGNKKKNSKPADNTTRYYSPKSKMCGERLTKITKSMKIKNYQLSEKLGCTPQHVSHIKSGCRTLSRENAKIIADYITRLMPDGESISAEYLLCETDIVNK